MRTRARIAILLAAGVVTAAWLCVVGPARVAADSLGDLAMDLQLVPLDGRAAKPFTLESLDGKKVSLADVAGRPALLYFWASW